MSQRFLKILLCDQPHRVKHINMNNMNMFQISMLFFIITISSYGLMHHLCWVEEIRSSVVTLPVSHTSQLSCYLNDIDLFRNDICHKPLCP